MEAGLVKALLHNKESEVLEFKRDQYAFYGGSNAEKAELLKDILALANAWKTCDAHILIGVEEVASGPAQMVGVGDHLKDADVQQFVDGKTNRAVKFLCGTVQVDGRVVDVIKIAQDQDRPIFLKVDFGGLKKEVVYVRRGSSTDVASPDEVAEMGAADAARPAPAPTIELEFANPSTRTKFGHDVQITSVVLIDPPPPPQHPMLPVDKEWARIRAIQQIADIGRMVTPLPFRTLKPKEVRAYREQMSLLTAVGFCVRNAGSAPALDVRIEIRGNTTDGFVIMDSSDLPSEPGQFPMSAFRSIHARLPETQVAKYEGYWVVSIHVGKIQPQGDVWVDDLVYIGSKKPVDVSAVAKAFADNLPAPLEYPLTIRIEIQERVYREEDFQPERKDDE